MKDRGCRNWAELPSDLTSSILLRLGAIEILENAQKVYRSWHRVCKDTSMWRKINMRNRGIFGYKCDNMCCQAIDRSEGGLVAINLEHFGNNPLLSYIAERSSYLRCLRLTMCYPRTCKECVNALMKLPFLEELEISDCYLQLNFKAIGHSCPRLKTLKLNSTYFSPDIECDDEALAIAESMPELRNLEIRGNRLTNRGLNAILDNCLYLEYLDLRGCFNINFFRDLKKRCSERIRDLRCPDDSTADTTSSSDTGSAEENDYSLDYMAAMTLRTSMGDIIDHSDIYNPYYD